MKTKVFIFMCLFFTSFVFGQAQEFESTDLLNEYVVKQIPSKMIVAANQDYAGNYCKALMVGATNFSPSSSAWCILDYASEYYTGDTWELVFVCANWSTSNVDAFVEFEIRWKDGGRKIYKRWKRTINSGYVMMYTFDITNQIKQKGLFTLIGRVSGKGIGNQNKVETQVYIY